MFYNYKEPDALPSNLFKTFDALVIDPPFITHEVWNKYADAAKLLLKTGHTETETPSKVICTTILENEPLLKELFGCEATQFQPSIPNLVYQYNLFTNYKSDVFAKLNPEIPQ